MKKTITSVISLFLITAIIMSFSGCFKTNEPTNAANPDFTKPDSPVVADSNELRIEKIGTLNKDYYSTYNGGLTYRDDDTDKYGVISLNGRYDTGAVYTSVQAKSKYFAVTKSKATSYTDIANLNSWGLIDGTGKDLIPMQYSAFNSLNDRFFVAYTATERTFDEDNYLIYFTDDMFSITASDDDILYNGNWCVYDLTTGQKVPGVTGTTNSTILAYGNHIVYYNANNNRITVDAQGKQLTYEDMFEDGSYTVEDQIGKVFDKDGNELFKYDLAGFIPFSFSDGYYVAKRYFDSTTKYVVLDSAGNTVSREFDSMPYIYGELLEIDGAIYNIKGDKIIDGTYSSINTDDIFGNAYFLRNEDTYTMIKSDGTVLYSDEYDDNTSIDTYCFYASEKKGEDGDRYYYSHKDKGYTLKGYSSSIPWLVEVEEGNGIYSLVDTTTNKKMLTGYENYASSDSEENASTYIFAKLNNKTDIYLLLNADQVVNVETMKADLLSDLTAAFNSAGITVNVNNETGELALDSSVLFGGDSAELTAEGKAFLDKFTKAYTSIIFSDKYKDFISQTFIEGHTAPVSGSTYADGLELSNQRAGNVKSYCQSLDSNIPADAFIAVGYSNSQPVYNANGEVDMDASRRVSFRFTLNIDD